MIVFLLGCIQLLNLFPLFMKIDLGKDVGGAVGGGLESSNVGQTWYQELDLHLTLP